MAFDAYGFTTCGTFNSSQYQHMLSADDSNAPRGVNNENDAEERGIKCEIKDLFFVESDKPHERGMGIYRWEDTKPVTTEANNKTQSERETYAVVKYNQYNVASEKWVTAYIRINNAKIELALGKVLEGYPGLTQHGLQMFAPPFLPFFHRWAEFTKHIDEETDEDIFHYLDLLRKMLFKELEGTFTQWEEIQKTGHIAYQDLQLAYDPAQIATYVLNGTRSAGIIRKCALCAGTPGQQPYFAVEIEVVDFDGRKCGLLSQILKIVQYVGLRAFSALDIAPLEYFEDQATIRQELIVRGRLFEKLRGQHFLAYSDKDAERLNERVMVDALAYHKFAGSSFPVYTSLNEMGRLTWDQSMQRFSTINQGSDPYAPRQYSHRRGRRQPPPPDYPHPPLPLPLPPPPPTEEGIEEDSEIDLSPLTDEQCLLCVHTVKSFDIEGKKWGTCEVTKLHEINWNELAFQNLVLNSEEKALLLALVNRKDSKKNRRFDDFIAGKGQGMVMLLSGPPGVGKTFTAESIAEHLRRPLYKLNAGDLGISAAMVEAGLSNALKLCAHWKAVCLIDEADVFMAMRTVEDLQRNELVSVFLRLLEYHSGILILTTNRLHTLDPAFESRIDLTLMYKSLDEADRKQVWKNFLLNIDEKDVSIDNAGLDKLAGWDVNGRQIKSAVKTARILAADNEEPLNTKHLELVLSLRLKARSFMSAGRE